ncbi:MAG: S1 RNA-binding domain-containing protein [Synergistaceae bacterium]|nr:S1 RNA-binding domain-containing protein [Synergistaceae bacterium]MBQ4418145.1 S1 RNA-binding domain-containing protein [Synergistaceae bacterium]MBQ7569400.1 S1 RNA-binding domain-containing protein [Synergistaceae bacterium]MBQ9581601.1 S1 RNA-binding domain-containing protein [Synergistaceae bacterium]MBQ9896524.1 S1 RNA-binding domain-containing protein [Synergistaceae bacterium]
MEEERKFDTSSGSGSASSIGIGDWVDCVVEQIMPYGAFVKMTASGRKGMIHISELSFNFVKKVEDVLSQGQNVRAKIIKIDDKGRIDLTLKRDAERQSVYQPVNLNQEAQGAANEAFEKKMASFLKVSESKIADLNSKSAPRTGRKRGGGRGGNNRDNF